MPYGRGRSFGKSRRYSRKSRYHAASTISRAWKRRRRRKTGLLSRTAQANRRAVKKLSKSVETKMIESTQATAANQFSGQFSDNIQLDNRGQEVISALPFFADILSGMGVGPSSSQRIGSWIQLKSITMKYTAECLQLGPAFLTLMLVHDSNPILAGGVTELLSFSGAVPFTNNFLDNSFQNLDQTGKDGRYKILWRKRHRLSEPTNRIAGTPVPPITTTQQAWGGDVQRPQYIPSHLLGAKAYPSVVNGSVTLKLPYKVNYGTGPLSIQPFNQTLRLCGWVTTQTGLAVPTTRLQYYIRVRYKDA